MKRKTGKSGRAFRRASHVFPGGVNSPVRFYPPYPAYISGGRGSMVMDVDGNAYTDYVLGYGPLILGHSEPAVIAAISRAVRRGLMYGAPSEEEVELGELIQKASPAVEMLRLVPSGSEATMHALRLSQFHTNRKRILKVKGGYHGTNTLAIKSPLVREVEFNSLEQARRELEKRIYAAFILEPALGNCGLVPPDREYLAGVRELTERTGTLLVADEVITGFRTCFGTFSESAGIVPDMVTMGKIVGGGMPLALYGGRSDVMKQVSPGGKFPQAGTYAAHPVSVAAGLETLRKLQKSDYSYLNELTETAVSRLKLPGISVNSYPGMLSIFFTDKKVTNGTTALGVDGGRFMQFFRSCLEKGIFVPPSQQEVMFLSFAHRRSEVAEQFGIMAELAGGE